MTMLRWKRSEWLNIAKTALPDIAAGMEVGKAFYRAQRKVLPRSRQRDESAMHRMWMQNRTRDHLFERYVNEATQQLAESVGEEAPPPIEKPKVQRTKKNISYERPADAARTIRWTPMEWAIIAREVKRIQDAGDGRSLGRMMCEAQLKVLPALRWRSEAGIMQGNQAGMNQRMLARGWLDQHLMAENEQLRVQAPTIEMVTSSPPPAARPQAAPPAASAPSPATAPAPMAPRAAFAFAMQAFASQFETALDALLKAHEQHIYTTLDDRMSRAAEGIGALVAKQITEGLRNTVVGIMTEELGGPVSPPPPSSAPSVPPAPSAPPSAAPSAPPVPAAAAAQQYELRGPSSYMAERVASVPVVYKGTPRRAWDLPELADDPADQGKVKVDIVGLIGVQQEEVRRAFNGHTSLRFVDATQVAGWVPRRDAHVVLNVKFISHDATLKCMRYHIKPLQVKGGAASVVHAIEAIHQNEGVPV